MKLSKFIPRINISWKSADTIDSTQGKEFLDRFREYFRSSHGYGEYRGFVYNAVDAWGLAFSKAKFRMYDVSNPKRRIEIVNHPQVKIFQRPNYYQSWWEMKYKIAQMFSFFGNCYIYKVRNLLKTPVAYQLLYPNLVRREFDLSTGLLKGYKYLGGHSEIEISPNDIIDLKYPNPYSDQKGFAIIDSLEGVIDIEKFLIEYTTKFYEEGGFLGAIFSTATDMSETAFARAKEELRKEYAGKGNSFRVGLFDNGLKPVASAYSMKDMDVTKMKTVIRDEVYSAWKVPKILMGIGENINRATAEASFYSFANGVVDPILSYIDDVLTYDANQEFGGGFEIAHDIIAPRDVEQVLKLTESQFKNGIISINEWRTMDGYDRVEGKLTDSHLINVGGSVVDAIEGVQIATKDTAKSSTETASTTQEQSQQEDKPKKSLEVKGFQGLDESDKILKWKSFDRRWQSSYERFNLKMNEFVREQGNRIIDALKNNYVISQAFDIDKEDVALWKVLEVELFRIFESGYRYGNLEYMDGAGKFNKQAFQHLYDALGAYVVGQNGFLKEKLEQLQHQTEQELLDAVKQFYANAPQTTNPLKTQTVTSAFNAGILMAMIDAGITHKMWLSSRDNRVRHNKAGEDHVEADGQVTNIHEPFIVKSRSGFDYMMYPADPNGSPENILNCRCTIIGEYN